MRILLVEDHVELSHWVAKALRDANLTVECAANGADADTLLHTQDYALVILDLTLPRMDGLDVLRRLRARGGSRGGTPVLILTARGNLEDRVQGLNEGADDYLAKPFSMVELVARVRALLRRPPGLVSLVANWQGLEVDPAQSCARYGDMTLRLSEAEAQVLLSLVRAGGAFLRRSQLEAAAWGLSVATTNNALDVVVYRLRTKLAKLDAPLELVVRRGVGYALAAR